MSCINNESGAAGSLEINGSSSAAARYNFDVCFITPPPPEGRKCAHVSVTKGREKKKKKKER
jgi:hypothetical protein